MSPFLAKLKWLQGHLVAVLVALFICAAVVAGPWLAARHSKTDTLYINGRNFSLEVANTPQAQELGLGKRTSLAANHGMLFVFSGTPVVQCFWMKDMHFPLDIIWVDTNKRVVHVEPDVSPDTYPKNFCPSKPAEYVIELNAGAAETAGIHDGETLRF